MCTCLSKFYDAFLWLPANYADGKLHPGLIFPFLSCLQWKLLALASFVLFPTYAAHYRCCCLALYNFTIGHLSCLLCPSPLKPSTCSYPHNRELLTFIKVVKKDDPYKWSESHRIGLKKDNEEMGNFDFSPLAHWEKKLYKVTGVICQNNFFD